MRGRLLVIIALIAAFAAVGVYAAKGKTRYVATLMGKKEVPPVVTKAKGSAKFVLTLDGAGLKYAIKESGIDNPTAAHIHSGAPGTNAPVVAVLYPATGIESPKENILAKGTITSADLVGPLKGKTIADLLDMIRSGNAYVNVHSKTHPDGVIRGWIKERAAK
jgi:hypothetical protein